MATDLILKGKFLLGGSFTDVSDEVTEVRLKAAVTDVAIPATLGTPKSHAGGSTKYEITVGYLAEDGSTGVLFGLLWAALGTASKELAWKCNLRDGATSGSNPQWQGVLIVSAADLGGDQETVSEGSITCTLVARPSKATS